jgi:hypothetical protein
MNQPDDLDGLERDLRDRPLPGPSPAFRQRVLDAMAAEARRLPEPTRPRPGALAAVAAALLLAVNLSMSVANDADFHFAAPMATGQVRETAQQVRALCPELSEDEALRHAVALQVRPGVAVPRSPAFSTRYPLNKEP